MPKTVHVKNLEKFHPGYKDRTLLWAKIHFNMVQGDPDCEMIDNEIDWARLIKFILLELQAKKPLPLDPKYLIKKGFNLKKRSISLTLQVLHNFIIVSTPENSERAPEESRIDKNRVDKNRENENDFLSIFNSFRKKYPGAKRGNETEFANLKKRHPNWKDVLPLLEPAIEKQKKARSAKLSADKWVPEWASLQVWINQSRWEIVVESTIVSRDKPCVICGTMTGNLHMHYPLCSKADCSTKISAYHRQKYEESKKRN